MENLTSFYKLESYLESFKEMHKRNESDEGHLLESYLESFKVISIVIIISPF